MSELLNKLYAALQSENLLAVSNESRALVAESPDLGGAWGQVADAALTAGDELTALAAAQKLTEAMPDHADSWLWVASVQASLGRHDAVAALLSSQARRFQSSGAIQRRLGRSLLELGQPTQAEQAFTVALNLDPSDSLSWEGLSRCKTFVSGDDDLADMEQLRLNWPPEAGADKRGVLSYAIAKAYEDMGEYETAGRRIAEGAAFYREAAPFDVEGHERGVEAILSVYDQRFAETNDEAGVLDARPVMILAPPRAGADWLARVLSTCEGSAGLARGNAFFWAASSPLGDQTPDHLLNAFRSGGRNILADVGHTYLRRLTEVVERKTARVVDPSGLLEIAGGAAGLCLPAARFIRITREPRDAAWSIYRHRFVKGRHWSYHPDDIARVLAAHNRLCDRWAELFPERYLTIAYEDLASNPQKVVADIARFAGLDPETAASEAWLTADRLKSEPVGVHQRGGSRFEAVEAALQRAELI
jgi:tetratricopeptide (TPR) repeat protein